MCLSPGLGIVLLDYACVCNEAKAKLPSGISEKVSFLLDINRNQNNKTRITCEHERGRFAQTNLSLPSPPAFLDFRAKEKQQKSKLCEAIKSGLVDRLEV